MLFFLKNLSLNEGDLTCEIEEIPFPRKGAVHQPINRRKGSASLRVGQTKDSNLSIFVSRTHSMTFGGDMWTWKVKEFRKMENRGIVMDSIVIFKDMSYMPYKYRHDILY